MSNGRRRASRAQAASAVRSLTPPLDAKEIGLIGILLSLCFEMWPCRRKGRVWRRRPLPRSVNYQTFMPRSGFSRARVSRQRSIFLSPCREARILRRRKRISPRSANSKTVRAAFAEKGGYYDTFDSRSKACAPTTEQRHFSLSAAAILFPTNRGGQHGRARRKCEERHL